MSEAAPETGLPDVDRFFHININCSDFERSLAFYQLLGFRVILDFGAGFIDHRGWYQNAGA